MAQRRMFSKAITNSGRFLTMPHESQALYFHLCLQADDDGVVEAFSVLRMTGANEDNLKVLTAKSFVRLLNEDLVSYITDWGEHNLLRADRKIDSVYKDLLVKILPEVKIMRAKKRADTHKKTTKRKELSTGLITGRPMDDSWTSNGPLSIGKDRLGKVSKEKVNTNTVIQLEDVADAPELTYWKEKTFTTIRSKYPENIKAAHRLKEKIGGQDFARAVETIPMIRADKYAGKSLHMIGNYIQLEKHIEAVEAYRVGIENRGNFEKATSKRIVSV